MSKSANVPRAQRQRELAAATNRFDRAVPGELGWHVHERGQFTLVESGISNLRTELGTWIVPPRRLSWVPAGVRHASRSNAPVKGWVVHAPVEFAKVLPARVCVLRASALMIAALERLTRLPAGEARVRTLLWRVIAAEVRDAQPEEFEVPMPTRPAMRKAVQSLLQTPSLADDLNALAARSRMSRRSFTRHFHAKTGMSFANWKRTVIAHRAIERIAGGARVSAVAFESGYESVSAFIAMFRRKYGKSPRYFLNDHSNA
jgi:AraC-like DNA-binding protein